MVKGKKRATPTQYYIYTCVILKMTWINRQQQFKTALVAAALLVAVTSLLVSKWLANDLAAEEYKRMELWSDALHTLNNADQNTDLSLVLHVIEDNNNIPVIVIDQDGNVTDHRNISIQATDRADTIAQLTRRAQQMKAAGRYVRIDGNKPGGFQLVCYDDSTMIRRITVWPLIQLGIVGGIVIIAILALVSFKRTEQNKLWVGLSKETAHQLGTPISSIMAWVEILKEEYPTDPYVGEIEKDVSRLNTIADRFSKIGAVPELLPTDICRLLTDVTTYIRKRTSSHVSFQVSLPSHPVMVPLCPSLFEWVTESLCKNAIDAMQGEGTLSLVLTDRPTSIILDVTDTGCGMTKSIAKQIFSPGFTTKKRGWGLGLSLSKRIIEKYHAGRLFVKATEPHHGTTFRIIVKK